MHPKAKQSQPDPLSEKKHFLISIVFAISVITPTTSAIERALLPQWGTWSTFGICLATTATLGATVATLVMLGFKLSARFKRSAD